MATFLKKICLYCRREAVQVHDLQQSVCRQVESSGPHPDALEHEAPRVWKVWKSVRPEVVPVQARRIVLYAHQRAQLVPGSQSGQEHRLANAGHSETDGICDKDRRPPVREQPADPVADVLPVHRHFPEPRTIALLHHRASLRDTQRAPVQLEPHSARATHGLLFVLVFLHIAFRPIQLPL